MEHSPFDDALIFEVELGSVYAEHRGLFGARVLVAVREAFGPEVPEPGRDREPL